MKLHFLSVLLVGAVTAAAQIPGATWTPQPDGSALLTWNGAAPEATPVEGGVVYRHPDAVPFLEAGAPDLCRFTTSLALETAPGWTWEIEAAEFEETTGVPVVPSRGNLYRNVDPLTVPRTEGAPYAQPAFWPAQPIDLGALFAWRGAIGQSLHLNPVAYRASDQTTRTYTHLTVRFTPIPGPEPRVEVAVDRMFAALHQRRFINAYAPDRYDQLDETARVLVLAPTAYFEAIAPWVQWKREKGLLVDVVDVAEAGTTAGQIAAYVAAAYTELEYGYLVLVGDEDAVPSELVVNGGGAGYCDPCYGYIEGDDHFPELLVGRFLGHNAAEITSIVNRTLEYERTPVMDTDWFSRAIAIGSAEGTGIGDDGQNDWQHNNAIKEQLLAFTYTAVQELYDGSQGGNSPSGGPTADANGSPGPNQFAAAVNAGASLINYTGHGSHNSIATTGFTNNDMDLLHNAGMWPYFIIVGCCVGDFDEATGSGDCFGEVWSKLESEGEATGGIGGAFSSVLQSWAPPMEGQDEMNALIAELGSVETEHTFGGIHFHGCSGMIEAYGTGGEEMMDTWCLFGDPTAVLRTAMPEPLVLTHDAVMPLGVSSMDAFCPVEGALVAATVEGNLLARGWVENGAVNLVFDAPINEPVEVLLTGTAFNHLPYQATVSLLPPSGPYVVDESVAFTDALGAGLNNANGIPESGEHLLLDVEVTNVGVDTAFNVMGTIATANPKVESWSAEPASFGTLAPGASVVVEAAFAVDLLPVAFEDGEWVVFELGLEADGGLAWDAGFSVAVRAPEWAWGGCTVADGNDGWLQSGETVDWTVMLTNVGGGAAVNAVVDAAAFSGPVTVVDALTNWPELAPGASAEFTAQVVVDSEVPVGSELMWTWSVESGPYAGESEECSAAIDLEVEDWEVAGDWPWEADAAAPWFATQTTAYTGTTSMQSGAIGANATTELSLDVELVNYGVIEFARAVSSEAGFDYLRFYVDGVLKGEWSGEVAWSEESVVVFGGLHTLKWAYEKDQIVSEGADAAWVDQIVLPANATVVGIHATESRPSRWTLQPNPATSLVTCGSTPESSTVRVTDAQGRLVLQQTFSPGASRQWSVSDWEPGVYCVQMGHQTKRLIVQ